MTVFAISQLPCTQYIFERNALWWPLVCRLADITEGYHLASASSNQQKFGGGASKTDLEWVLQHPKHPPLSTLVSVCLSPVKVINLLLTFWVLSFEYSAPIVGGRISMTYITENMS